MQTQPAKSFTDVHVLRYQGNLFFRIYSDSDVPISAQEALEALETNYPDDVQPCAVREIKVFVFGGSN
jgi:hypothetical protein